MSLIPRLQLFLSKNLKDFIPLKNQMSFGVGEGLTPEQKLRAEQEVRKPVQFPLKEAEWEKGASQRIALAPKTAPISLELRKEAREKLEESIANMTLGAIQPMKNQIINNLVVKKFDKEVVKNLIKKISKELKNKNPLAISLSLKENNIIKEINKSASETLFGAWNGYGYENLGKHLTPKNFKEINEALLKIPVEIKKEIVPKTQEQIIESWSKKLSKLTNISIEDAKLIAQEKLNYKDSQIDMMMDRQKENFSIKRAKLINQMMRENPLRPIKDGEHAQNILSASNRHTRTNYEEKLKEGKGLRDWGLIDDPKEFARNNFE